MPERILQREVVDRILAKQLLDARAEQLQSPEEIFAQHPELQESDEGSIDIIFHDFLLRQEFYGVPQQVTDYLERFPSFKPQLERQFQLYRGVELADARTDAGQIDTDSNPAADVSSRFSSRYTLLEKLGEGSFAVVFRGQDLLLKRNVAIKIAKFDFSEDPRRYQRVEREAEAAARLVHPSVVGMFELGDHQGRPFLVQEFMAGGNLASRLASQTVAFDRAAAWMHSICEAADYAHRLGIVHRDIKPSNILFDSNSRPKLGDFGLASLSESESTLTQQGDLLGTPAYMSPEQVIGDLDAGPASDVYSLGVVFYELLCGQPPFQGSAASVMQQACETEPMPPSRLVPSVPRDLEIICLKAMQKRPRDRYASASAMADDLRRFQNGEPIFARALSPMELLIRRMQRYPVASSLLFGLVLILGFLAGGAMQYFDVVQQRNRAQQAELRNERLLAKESVRAGDSAWQRGRWQLASENYRHAIERGVEDQFEVMLKLARCEMVLGHSGQAKDWLEAAGPKSLDDEYRFLRAQLLLQTGQNSLSTIEELDRIEAQSLSPAEREFLLGLRANQTPLARDHFESVLQYEPYHHSARRMALLCTLSLADFETVLERVEVALEMFPDDVDFQLIKAMALACEGKLESAESIVDRLASQTSELENWSHLIEFLDDVCRSDKYLGSDSLPGYRELKEMVSVFQAECLPAIRARRWYLPPKIESQLQPFFSQLPIESSNPQSSSIDALETNVVLVHPEATLATIVGRERLNRPPQDRNRLRSVRSVFETAVAAHSFRQDTDVQARFSLFGVAANLALVKGDDVDANLQLSMAMLRQLDPASLKRLADVSVGARFAIRMKAWDVADRYTAGFVQRAEISDSSKSLFDALWNRAVFHEARGEWLQVVQICDQANRLLEEDESLGDRQTLASLRSRACHEMVLQMEIADNLFPWASVFESALLDQQWGLAEQLLARMESNAIKGSDDLILAYRDILRMTRHNEWNELLQILQALQQRQDLLVGQQLERLLKQCQSQLR